MGKWLDRSFVFYAGYHSDFINQLIHYVCIWPIFFTSLTFLAYTDPLVNTAVPLWLGSAGVVSFNWSFIIAFIYALYYTIIEFPGIAGPIAALGTYYCYINAAQWVAVDPDAWKTAAYINGAAWVFQFYGHFVHEGRAPALKDNLVQAFLMAPLFVVMELLFTLGYRPEFRARVEDTVKTEAAIRKAKGL
jgi:uncharacterized membrane protein YGL010W